MSKDSKSGKSSILKDAFVLVVITLIAGFSLGFVHEITAPAIEAGKLKQKAEAYQEVFPEAAKFSPDDTLTKQTKEASETVLKDNGYEAVSIDEAYIALDKDGNKIGYVMTLTTQDGYKGGISLSLGYGTDGVTKGMKVLVNNETAGLGAKASASDFTSQFSNKKVDKFEYTKSGAANDNQIDALSGATITTAAVVDEVNAGICFITQLVEAGNK